MEAQGRPLVGAGMAPRGLLDGENDVRNAGSHAQGNAECGLGHTLHWSYAHDRHGVYRRKHCGVRLAKGCPRKNREGGPETATRSPTRLRRSVSIQRSVFSGQSVPHRFRSGWKDEGGAVPPKSLECKVAGEGGRAGDGPTPWIATVRARPVLSRVIGIGAYWTIGGPHNHERNLMNLQNRPKVGLGGAFYGRILGPDDMKMVWFTRISQWNDH